MRALWLVIGALVMLPACSAAPTKPLPTPTPSQQQRPTEAVLPTAVVPSPTAPTSTPTPAPFLAAVGPTCSARDLSVREGFQGAGLGNGVELLIFTDRGPGRCTLRGTPGVRFLSASGQLVNLPVFDQPDGYFPTTANSGVGLLPLNDPGARYALGVRGQAALPFQYSDNMCATSRPMAKVEILLPSGRLTTSWTFNGFTFPDCAKPAMTVNPFQPAEATG